MAGLSDNEKFAIQMVPVFITLLFLFFSVWESRRGRARDNVTVNDLRWRAQRLSVRESTGLTELEISKLQDNAEKARKAMELLKHGKGPHMCPWAENGQICPVDLLQRQSGTSMSIPVEGAYEHVQQGFWRYFGSHLRE